MSGLKIGRMLGGVAVAAALAAGLAACGPKADVASSLEGQRADDAVAELVKGTESEGVMASVRQRFPDVYAPILAAVQSAPPSKEARLAAFEQAYGAFLNGRGSSATLASDERLTEWVRTRVQVARALQAQDPALCGGYFTFGHWGQTRGAPEVLKASAAAGAAFTDAIADGEAHPVQRSAASRADARALGMAFGDTGASLETIDLVKSVALQGDGFLRGLPGDKQCAFGIAYFDALLAVDPEIRGRIVSRLTMKGRFFSS